MDQADAELLERIEQGDRVFRPGPGELGRRSFQAMLGHLRELRDRGFLDMPERTVSQMGSREESADENGENGEEADDVAGASDVGTETEGHLAGGYLMAGPCYVTAAGRAALDTFRRGDRRAGDRRQGDRRQAHASSAMVPSGDRRQGDRRQGDRRQGDRRQGDRRQGDRRYSGDRSPS